MRIPVGAVALALQPKIETVETLTFWNTFDAVLYLLDMEAKHKVRQGVCVRGCDLCRSLTSRHESQMRLGDFVPLIFVLGMCVHFLYIFFLCVQARGREMLIECSFFF